MNEKIKDSFNSGSNQKFYMRYDHATRDSLLVRQLSAKSFHLWNILLTCERQKKNYSGIIYADNAYLAYATKLQKTEVVTAMEEILDRQDPNDPSLIVDAEINLFWIVNYTKHQALSRNHLISAINNLIETPMPEYIFNQYLIKYAVTYLNNGLNLPKYTEPLLFNANLNEILNSQIENQPLGSTSVSKGSTSVSKGSTSGDQRTKNQPLPSSPKSPKSKKSSTRIVLPEETEALPKPLEALPKHSLSASIKKRNEMFKTLILSQRKELKQIVDDWKEKNEPQKPEDAGTPRRDFKPRNDSKKPPAKKREAAGRKIFDDGTGMEEL